MEKVIRLKRRRGGGGLLTRGGIRVQQKPLLYVLTQLRVSAFVSLIVSIHISTYRDSKAGKLHIFLILACIELNMSIITVMVFMTNIVDIKQ